MLSGSEIAKGLWRPAVIIAVGEGVDEELERSGPGF